MWPKREQFERLQPDVLHREPMIQWYPGHMAKTQRALAKAFPSQDVIIEILDARMPFASSNPAIAALRKQKPCIKILSKADLADPAVTTLWLRCLSTPQTQAPDKVPGCVVAIASSSNHFAPTKQRIIDLCKRLTGRKGDSLRPIRAMVVGIPNVGKSTIINLLIGRKVAKVGDEPAVTKMQQQVELESGIMLSDNPGLLWPNISDEATGLCLAFGGAFSEAALDYESVARFGAGVLLERYPKLVTARYKLAAQAENADALLKEIGRRRGCLRKDGDIDIHKAADVLIHDFRQGSIGRISLEVPPAAAPDSADDSAQESSRTTDTAGRENP